jgi:hypothetical protein
VRPARISGCFAPPWWGRHATVSAAVRRSAVAHPLDLGGHVGGTLAAAEAGTANAPAATAGTRTASLCIIAHRLLIVRSNVVDVPIGSLEMVMAVTVSVDCVGEVVADAVSVSTDAAPIRGVGG